MKAVILRKKAYTSMRVKQKITTVFVYPNNLHILHKRHLILSEIECVLKVSHDCEFFVHRNAYLFDGLIHHRPKPHVLALLVLHARLGVTVLACEQHFNLEKNIIVSSLLLRCLVNGNVTVMGNQGVSLTNF